jgi:type II secretory pathway pseudopilin PulG
VLRLIQENMLLQTKQIKADRTSGFALGETLIAFAILSIVFAGLIYGYVQANRMAEWTSMSLAAQSYASEGAEQARAADWRPRDYPVTNGYGTMDELTNGTVLVTSDIMDVPIKGSPTNSDFSFWVTNYISVTNYSINPPIRKIRSDCKWTFPLTGQVQSNTVILLRAGDQ